MRVTVDVVTDLNSLVSTHYFAELLKQLGYRVTVRKHGPEQGQSGTRTHGSSCRLPGTAG